MWREGTKRRYMVHHRNEGCFKIEEKLLESG